MKLKASKAIIITAICLCVVLSLVGCDVIDGVMQTLGLADTLECEHRDADDNSLCDKCEEEFTDSKDIEGDPEEPEEAGDPENPGEPGDEETPDGGGEEGGDTACTHTPGEWITDTPASCKAAGARHKVCTLCGETVESETINALPHTPGDWVTKSEPTCATAGEKTKECTVCGALTEREDIPKLTEHTKGSATTENEVKASCTVDGSYDEVYYCTVSGCGAEISRNTQVVPAGHNYVGGACTACGEYVISDGLEFRSNGDGTCTLVGIGNCTDKAIVIPSTVGEDSVTSIADGALRDELGITSLVIPDSVTSIGQYAFYGCYNLIGAVIGEGVTSIGTRAFQYCMRLVEVVNKSELIVEAGETSNGYLALYTIDVHDGTLKGAVNQNGYLFYTANDVNYLIDYVGEETELSLPASYNGESYVLKGNAFYGNTLITDVTMTGGITEIGSQVFTGCTSLEEVVICDSVTRLDASVFYNSTNLKSVTLGNGITEIPRHMFYLCTSLTELEIPGSVNKIGAEAFRESGIKNITIPDSVTSMLYDVFKDCTKLESVVIGDGLSIIYGGTFSGCVSLESVTVGSGVNQFGGNVDFGWGNVFEGCTSIKEVYIHSIEEWCKISFWDEQSNPLYHSENLYVIGQTEPVTELIIPGAVGYVRMYTFPCKGITSAIISEGVKSIYGSAFANSGLVSISLPSTLTTIGAWAFEDCTSLKSIEIPEGISMIDTGVFYGCTSLTDVKLPSILTLIEDYAFEACTALQSIKLPDGLKTICDSVFAGCTALAEIKLNEGLTEIGQSVFEGCSSLTEIVIPEGISNIPYGAFSDCTSLRSITIPSSVTTIRGGFSSCYRLVEVINKSDIEITVGASNNGGVAYYAIEVHDGESKIATYGDYLFYTTEDGTNYLIGYVGDSTELILPENYNGESYAIREYAFYKNEKITNVVIPSAVTKIGKYAFVSCRSLTSASFEDTEGWWRSADATATEGTEILTEKLSTTDTAASSLVSLTTGKEYWTNSN